MRILAIGISYFNTNFVDAAIISVYLDGEKIKTFRMKPDSHRTIPRLDVTGKKELVIDIKSKNPNIQAEAILLSSFT